jgi:hypothetical protein
VKIDLCKSNLFETCLEEVLMQACKCPICGRMNNTKDPELIEYESINSGIIRCVSECFNDYRAMVRLHIDRDYDG